MAVSYTNTSRSLSEWMDRVIDRIKRQLMVDKTVASKRTYNSIDKKMDGQLSVQLLSNEAKGSGLSTLEIIDKGRRRGSMPPVDDIMKWMDDKNIRPKNSKGGFAKSSNRNKKAAAYAIAKSIGDKGTIKRFGYRGSDIFNYVTTPILDEMTQDIMQSYVNDVERYVKNRGK